MPRISLSLTARFGALCALALAGSGTVSAQTAKVPDFSGYFSQGGSVYLAPSQGGVGPVMDDPNYPHQKISPVTGKLVTEWVGDSKNPNLKPQVAAEIERMNKIELSGGVNLASYQLCMPVGVPLILTQRENMQVLQQPDEITMIFQRDEQVRHIKLAAQHSAKPTPSWYGESIGHYEGDVLVVDTIGLNGKSRADRYGSFSSDQTHVVERYYLADNGQTLQVDLTVTDPVNFNQPWNATQKFRRQRGPIEEILCAENNRDALSSDKGQFDAQPHDETPDF